GDDRTLIFQVSNSQPDRDGDVLPAENWFLENFKRNPISLWAHDHSQPPIGRVSRIWQAGNALMAAITFATTDFAESVYQLCRQGFLNATSVGFRASTSSRNKYGGVTYDAPMELLEVSLVPIPANPDALIQARAAGINLVPVLKYFTRESPK